VTKESKLKKQNHC